MPLPKPPLDNRRYDELVAEGRSQLPRLAPGWTDHNASDPGITLLELGAWLAEQNIYRLDRLSPQALRSFVRLAGIEPAAATVAHTVVAIDNAGPGMALPARLPIAGTAGPGTPVLERFETTADLWASPAKLVQLRAGKAPGQDVMAANGSAPFEPFGRRARVGHALWLGFDQALDAPGRELSLHFWNEHWATDDATRALLLAEYDAAVARGATPRPWQQHYRVQTVWEFYAGAGQWQPLAAVQDETRALSQSGFVRLAAPVGHQPLQGVFWLRCRIARGHFECPPRLVQVSINAVPCEHASSRAESSLGTTRGHAGAVFGLGESPVVASSVALRLDDGSGSVLTDWRCVPDWDRAGPHDRVMVLDAERGELVSGNGLHGTMPPAGYQLFARWRAGGGSVGNVDPRSLVSIPSIAAALQVRQPFAAQGGAPMETIEAAQARAFDLAEAVDKAVTLQDIERLALSTPGTPVARVRAVAGYDAHWPCYPATGVVSVVVIPHCPKPAPMPSKALLCEVERYLAPRRLVTSELHAIAPHYRRIGVRATLHVACGSDAAGLVAAAEARIGALFDPIHGGPEGQGWPFGRPVYRNDVMSALAQLPGVARVTGFALLSGGESSHDDGAACAACATAGGADDHSCDNVALCEHELPRPGRHRFTVASDTPLQLTRSHAHECPSA